jgi:hypothetical protein
VTGGQAGVLGRLSFIAVVTSGGRLFERSQPRRVLACGVPGMSRKHRHGDLLLAASPATGPLTALCV